MIAAWRNRAGRIGSVPYAPKHSRNSEAIDYTTGDGMAKNPHAVALGRLGGKVSTPAEAKAARKNADPRVRAGANGRTGRRSRRCRRISIAPVRPRTGRSRGA